MGVVRLMLNLVTVRLVVTKASLSAPFLASALTTVILDLARPDGLWDDFDQMELSKRRFAACVRIQSADCLSEMYMISLAPSNVVCLDISGAKHTVHLKKARVCACLEHVPPFLCLFLFFVASVLSFLFASFPLPLKRFLLSFFFSFTAWRFRSDLYKSPTNVVSPFFPDILFLNQLHKCILRLFSNSV